MCEHYIGHRICTDFPDWSIAPAGSEAALKIGYDYGRSVTGVELEIEPDLDEEVVQPDSDQQVPDLQEERSMVATSAEVNIMCMSQVAQNTSYFIHCLRVIYHFVTFQALQELGLDDVDLVDEAPSFFEPTPEDKSE